MFIKISNFMIISPFDVFRKYWKWANIEDFVSLIDQTRVSKGYHNLFSMKQVINFGQFSIWQEKNPW